ncbi:Beta-barrel assembly machine subunit BamD [Sphaerotilus hippei]|uniref:Outer membrane protein assembly factor BamD n=1 Tax=Sphaerotilus hippei TaxID=744406 RepID=A0A318H4F5_9BURK|nr:outer membrane protein assembly factor BamD [Sphaerotilus hippei]PXW98621.1 Beta-barrel assembly machine subunit BamD [Sphaerotilus hippei]
MLKLRLPAARFLCSLFATVVLAASVTGCASDPKNKPETKNVAKLYEEAREEQAAGAYERAIKLYEQLEGLAAGTLLAQQAQLERAYLLYRSAEPAQALAVTERFLKFHPTSPAADYAYYLQGLINFNDDLGLLGSLAKQDMSERDQRAAREAYDNFVQLVDRFPDSKYAPDARQRINYIVNALSAYEVHVARYYYTRGAYVASANRAQSVLQDFRAVPASEEALYLMAASYDRLGMTQLRDDAVRVLRTNFPKSAWLDRIGADFQVEKRWWTLW